MTSVALSQFSTRVASADALIWVSVADVSDAFDIRLLPGDKDAAWQQLFAFFHLIAPGTGVSLTTVDVWCFRVAFPSSMSVATLDGALQLLDTTAWTTIPESLSASQSDAVQYVHTLASAGDPVAIALVAKMDASAG